MLTYGLATDVWMILRPLWVKKYEVLILKLLCVWDSLAASFLFFFFAFGPECGIIDGVSSYLRRPEEGIFMSQWSLDPYPASTCQNITKLKQEYITIS